MPRTNKTASKKPEKAETPTQMDGPNKEEMYKEQLKEQIVQLQEELDKEREERNYFQMERDRIQALCEITLRQTEEATAKKKILDKEIEEDECRHQLEIKVYQQKIKHVLCEHQNTLSEVKADGLVSMEAVQKEQQKLEAQLHQDMRAITESMKELDIESQVRELQLKHDEEMTEQRNRLETKLAEAEASYDKKLELLKQDLENQHKTLISEKEDQWNSHINALIQNHNKVLNETREMKDKDRLKEPLLKKEMKVLASEREKKKSELGLLLQEKKLVAEKLSKALEEIADIEKKTKYYRPTKNTQVKVKEKQLNDLKREHETLRQKFTKLQQERNELRDTFTQNIEKVQQKADERLVKLEKKLKDLTVRVEERDAQLAALPPPTEAQQAAVDAVIKQLEEGDEMIKDLKYKIALIDMARKDLIRTTDAKLFALGVPAEQRKIE